VVKPAMIWINVVVKKIEIVRKIRTPIRAPSPQKEIRRADAR
jgi:hypothetical protein